MTSKESFWEIQARKEARMTAEDAERRLRTFRGQADKNARKLLAQLTAVIGTPKAPSFLAKQAFLQHDLVSASKELERRLDVLSEFDLGTPVAYFARHSRLYPLQKPFNSPMLVTDQNLVLLEPRATSRKFRTHDVSDAQFLSAPEHHENFDCWTVDLRIGERQAASRFHSDDPLRLQTALVAACLLRVRLETAAAISRTGAQPDPRLIRTPRDAEQAAADWLTYFGYGAARVTANGPDGGLDVVAAKAVAQVKMEGVPVGRPVIQQLHGCASVEGKDGFVFSLGGFTPDAIAWADRAGVALFTFDFQGEPAPANNRGRLAAR